MRGLLAATAVLGVLAIGGLPALALTLSDAETGADSTAQASVDQRPGPPPWARGHDKAGKEHKDGKPPKDKNRANEDGADGVGPPGWARHGDQVPPGWARNHAGRTPHGWAMRTWAHCVADAAANLTGGEKLDPEAACGARPEPPRGPGR